MDESGVESAGSNQANLSATAESKSSQGAIPRSLEFLRPLRHHSIPIAHQNPHLRGSVHLIFFVIRPCIVGKIESFSRATEKMLFVFRTSYPINPIIFPSITSRLPPYAFLDRFTIDPPRPAWYGVSGFSSYSNVRPLNGSS